MAGTEREMKNKKREGATWERSKSWLQRGGIEGKRKREEWKRRREYSKEKET